GASCPSERLCAALVGSRLFVSTDPADGRNTWVQTTPPQAADEITCPTETLCVLASSQYIEATTDPTDPSPTWTQTTLPPEPTPSAKTTGLISGLSCSTPHLCVAVEQFQGYALVGDPTDPQSWTITKIPQPSLLSYPSAPRMIAGISCQPDNTCTAIDSDGRITTGQATSTPT